MKTWRLGWLLLSLGTVVLACRPVAVGQEAQTKPSVELTDKAARTYVLKKAEAGGKVLADKGYVWSSFPDELAGGYYLLRDSGAWAKFLPPLAVKAEKDVTVYLLLRVKAFGTEKVGEAAFNQLAKEGWSEVKGEVAGTFNAGEGWEWKAIKKGYKKGNLIIHVKNVALRCPMVFAFK